MKKRRTMIISLLLVAALALGVGYAALSKELQIGGIASFRPTENTLNVNFTAADKTTVPTTAEATAAFTANTATFSITKLATGEEAVFTYTIKNEHAQNVGAKITGVTESYSVVLGEGTGTTVEESKEDNYVSVDYAIYHEDGTTPWVNGTDILGYNETLKVVVTVSLNANLVDLVSINDYALVMNFGAEYDF